MKVKTFILVFLWIIIAGVAVVALGIVVAPESVINLYDLANGEFTWEYAGKVGDFMMSLLSFQIPDIPFYMVVGFVWVPLLTLIIMAIMLIRGVPQ